MIDLRQLGRGNVDSGRLLEGSIVAFAVGLVFYLIFSVLPLVQPVDKWFSSTPNREELLAVEKCTTVQPVYPLTALCIGLAVWFYHHNSIPSDWMDPAGAGAKLNSARVHARTGLQDRSPPFWKRNLRKLRELSQPLLEYARAVAAETGKHVAIYFGEASNRLRATIHERLRKDKSD